MRRSKHISTHALTEGDYWKRWTRKRTRTFQLTPSRRATAEPAALFREQAISTHALTEGDLEGTCETVYQFISTHALTEGDERRMQKRAEEEISTHALTEGDDPQQAMQLML